MELVLVRAGLVELVPVFVGLAAVCVVADAVGWLPACAGWLVPVEPVEPPQPARSTSVASTLSPLMFFLRALAI